MREVWRESVILAGVDQLDGAPLPNDLEIRERRVVGTLSRSDLESLASAGALQSDGALLIGQNTLKLHIGSIAWMGHKPPSERRTRVDDGHPIRIGPGDVATVVTQESTQLPLGVSGRIFPRGRLLPIGILVPTVHIDPGFSGHLRIILANVGHHVVEIPYGFEVARAEFTSLVKPVGSAYHGVNSELKNVNPQADELVVETMSRVDVLLSDLTQRILRLEATIQSRTLEVRRLRKLNLIGWTVLVAAGLAGLAVVGVSTFLGDVAKEISVSVVTAGAVGASALLFSAIRLRLGRRLREWLLIDASTGTQHLDWKPPSDEAPK